MVWLVDVVSGQTSKHTQLVTQWLEVWTQRRFDSCIAMPTLNMFIHSKFLQFTQLHEPSYRQWWISVYE